MAKKKDEAGRGKSLAPIDRGAAKTALSSGTAKGLVPAVVPPGGVVVRDGGTTLVAGRPYRPVEDAVEPTEIVRIDLELVERPLLVHVGRATESFRFLLGAVPLGCAAVASS